MPRIAIGETLFGRYVIEEMADEGYFGWVYFARDNVLPRTVAIKELKPHWLAEPEIVKRFLNEARAAARLQHPNIVTILDVKPEDRPRFIILERLAESLRSLMKKEGQLPVRRAIRIATEICSALELAHAHGIIHRDLKPENLLVASTGEVKICDFGIAHLPRGLGGSGTVLRSGQAHPGTPIYRSPEQIKGLSLDGRSDLYTVGAILYEMLAGRHYFDSSAMSWAAIDEFIVRQPPVPPSQFLPAIPPDMEALILRLLEKDPAARLPDAASVIQALDKVAVQDEGQPVAAFAPVLAVLSANARREGNRTRFQVRMEATNEGVAAANNWCGLTFHFPSLSDKDGLSEHDIRAWGSADPFLRFPGDLIWGFREDGSWAEIPARHLMVEFAMQKWSPGEHFHLEAVLLLDLPEITVHARAWGSIRKADGSEIASHSPPWVDADTKDQQGFPCNLLRIGLKR
ncbi:MAG: serine/threonine-protein kinase [Terracidiphilus sp.]